MKKKYVIANVPAKFPIQSTVLYAFLLNYFHASGIVWGIFITLYLIYWIAIIAVKWNEEVIDLNSDEVDERLSKSKFAQRLTNLLNGNDRSRERDRR